MRKSKVIFLGYLWKIPNVLLQSDSFELIGIGLEYNRVNTKNAVDNLEKCSDLFFDAKKINENRMACDLFSQADYVLVGAFGQIINRNILKLPRYGFYNFHTSYLPIYRGNAPIENLIMNGDNEGGVTLHCMDEGIDTGLIVSRRRVEILNTDHYFDVYEKYHDLAEAMTLNLSKFIAEDGTFTTLQINEKHTDCKKFDKNIQRINNEDSILDIFRKVKSFGHLGTVILQHNKNQYICKRVGLPKEVDEVNNIKVGNNRIEIIKDNQQLEIMMFKLIMVNF